MRKNYFKLLLTILMMVVGGKAWGQISSWTSANSTYTSEQKIVGSVSDVVTMKLGADDGWIYDTNRNAVVTRSMQTPTLSGKIPTAGGYVVIKPTRTLNFSLTTYSSQSNCNLVMYDEAGNKLKDFRQKAYCTNDFGTLEAGKNYYIYGTSFKAAGNATNLEYVFYQKFTATTIEEYTIRYVDENNNKIKDDVVYTGLYGTTVTASSEDMSEITYNNELYAYKSGNSELSLTNGTNIITLVYTKGSAANLTVKYVDSSGNSIADNLVISSTVGTEITVADENIPNYITFENVKYKYVSGNTSITLSGNDENDVITLVYAEASQYSYNVNIIDNTSNVLSNIASGSVYEGEDVTLFYSERLLCENSLYKVPATNREYRVTFSPDADNYVYNITASSPDKNVVFFTEGEDIEGVSKGTNIYRASMGYMGYTRNEETFLPVTTITPGKYKIYLKGVNGNSASRLAYFKIGDNVVYEATITNSTGLYLNSDVFLVEEEGVLSFACTGSSASGIDWFYIQEIKTTSNVTFFETTGAEATIKMIINGNETNVTDGVELEPGTYSFTATAENYEDYTGEFEVSETDVTNGTKSVSFTMTSTDVVKSITVKYMYNNEEIFSESQANVESLTAKVGDTYIVPFRAYVVNNGILYQTRNNNSNPYYGESTVLTKETIVEKNVSVVDLNGGTLAFFVDLDATDAQNAGVRASYCSAYDNKSYTSEETLEAGTYSFIIRKQNKGRGSSIAIGETTIYNIDGGNGSWGNVNLKDIKVTESGKLSLVAGGNSTYDDYDIIIAIRQRDTETITITSAGVRTYCSENVLDFSDVEGLKAYFLTVDGDRISMNETTLVGGFEGVYIEAAEGSYEVPVMNDLEVEPLPEGVNDLVGVTEATEIDAPIYVLMNEDKGLGFYKTSKTFTVGAHTAYIPGAAVPTGVKALGFEGNDDPTTGINGVNSEVLNGKAAVIYNLAGQRVTTPVKGIYIVNGKKVMVK